ncbi:hypothetical protein I316_05265 [Kwoniella heveanensis BCC8398]|uniref:Uncharacterized protein n=1 Tax=Kwoniella heveanensis BCC8398 TaxID=1296120 RepID=A0A1B9GPL3_9TREE|nr:hypothetical protein I316_05265 [Kwoniella heveanensis BCC8398]
MTHPTVKEEGDDDLSDMVNISPPTKSAVLARPDGLTSPETTPNTKNNADSIFGSRSIPTSDSHSEGDTSKSDPSLSSDTLESTNTGLLSETSTYHEPEVMTTPVSKREGVAPSTQLPDSALNAAIGEDGDPDSKLHLEHNRIGAMSADGGKQQVPKSNVNIKRDAEVLKDVQSVVEDTVRRVRQQSDKFQSAAQPYADKTRSFAERRPVLFTFLVLWASFSSIPVFFFLTFALISTAIIASTAIFFLALTIIGTVLFTASVLLCTLCVGLLVLFPVLCISTFIAFSALSTFVGIFLAHRLYLHIKLAKAEDEAGLFSIATLFRGVVSWIDETIERIPLPFQYSFPRLSTYTADHISRADFPSVRYGPGPTAESAGPLNEKSELHFDGNGTGTALDEKWFDLAKYTGDHEKGNITLATRLHTNALSDGRLTVEEIENLNRIVNGHGNEAVKTKIKNGTGQRHALEEKELLSVGGGSVLSEKEGLRYESKPTPRLDIWPPAPKIKPQ